jgi:hypothetical protein
MGCDIHIYRERFTNGRWESVDKWSDKYGEGSEDVCYPDQCYEGRNYDLFGVLAKGVRREFDFSFEPRGMPLQCDPRIAAVAERIDEDGHNHSYLYLHELRELQEWAKGNTMPVSGMMDAAQWEALQASIASSSPDWNLLYPYCQWTNNREAVEFNVEVPVSFNLGDGIDKIVDSFSGIDGGNHRVVFWFDN